VDIIQTRRDIR